MQLPHQARALERSRAPAKAADEVNVVNRRSNLANQVLQEAKILFQTYFKSVGPRTYAAQLKQAGNGNHFLVFTEGKRDDKTGDLRKISLFLFSEDFENFFKLIHETEQFVRAHPVPKEVQQKRQKFWAKQSKQGPKGA